MNETEQRDLAYNLWEWGFGEDPLRNWFMSGIILTDEELSHFKDYAFFIAHYSSSTTSMKQAKRDYDTAVSNWIYRMSLKLDRPSSYEKLNWIIAQEMHYWLLAPG